MGTGAVSAVSAVTTRCGGRIVSLQRQFVHSKQRVILSCQKRTESSRLKNESSRLFMSLGGEKPSVEAVSLSL